MTAVSVVLVLLVVVIVAAVAVMSVRRVPPDTWAVVERSGAYRTALRPGLHLIVPVLDQVTAEIDMTEQVLSLEEPLVTGDNHVVRADIEITYVVEDPFLVYLAGSSAAPLEIAVRSALRQYAGVADRDFVTASDARLAEIASDALGRAREDSGVRVRHIHVTTASLEDD